MPRSFQPYAETLKTSTVHEDGNDVQPSSEDYYFEHDTASTFGFSHIPHSPCNKTSSPPHLLSDPFPVHATSFGYETSHYASSEPSPAPNGSPHEYSSEEKGYYYDRKIRELEECQRRLERCRQKLKECQLGKKAAEEVAEGKIESLRLLLFHSLKEAKKYNDAEKLYRETVTDRGPTESVNTVILDLKHSFAGMLIEQEKFQEAEPISRAVWEERKQCPGATSEVSKESHRQLCSVLCAVRKYKDAESMHRRMYQRETMDAWALENGDEVCQRRRDQGEIKRAKEMQDEVWNERLKQNGPRDPLTIRGGLRLIGFLEELVGTIDRQGGTDAERRLNISHKQAFQCEIEVILRKIWDTRLEPEPSVDVLNAGNKLGGLLFLRNNFSDAETIFLSVWEGKKQQLGDTDVSTLSTGSMLGKSLYRQGKRENYLRAVEILQGIWLMRQTVTKSGDVEAITSGENLAQAYSSLGDWSNAERVYRWIVHQKAHKRGCPTREVDDTRWNLGQTLFKQGVGKDREAEIVLGELYQQWNANSPNSNLTLQCGQMLAQSLSTQSGRNDEALEVARDVFSKRRAIAERGVAYLDSGRLYGSLLLEVGSFAEADRILESMWGHQAEGDEERKVRVTCGQLYGQTLAKKHKYPDAKRILEAVAEAQEAVSAGALEMAETRQLLENINRLRKKNGKKKQTSFQHWGFFS